MVATKKRATRSKGRMEEPPFWIDYTDEQLLDLRLCDLGLQLAGSPLEPRLNQLETELRQKGLEFRPHYWLSDEWFTPDNVPGIAIPFYLAHPRLERLERRQMFEVEGGTQSSCMRILRHEAGHAIDNAYRLGKRRSWRATFGNAALPYPEHYKPRPNSRSFVQHLDMWYAQAHPAEDFAETFAVWLKPRSAWRSQYQGWPALQKLHYVDELMVELSRKKPLVTSRLRVDSIRSLRKTLREHYQIKKDRYGIGHPTFYDRDLLKLFSDSFEHRGKMSAVLFLRRHRSELRRAIGEWTGEYLYTIDQVLKEMIDRCRELKLRLRRSEPQTKRAALVMLAVQTMNYLHGGKHRVAL